MRGRNRSSSTETFYQYSDSITKMVFQNKMSPIETELSWDVSENNDGNCMAYLVSNQEETDPTYTLYIQGYDVIYLSDGYCLFNEFSKLDTIVGLEYVDTFRVRDMGYMFRRCDSLISLDLSYFDTSQATRMTSMFDGSALVDLNLSSFDTSQVTNMNEMFSWCSDLISVNLSSFDTSQVTSMNQMFCACYNLKTLDFRNTTFTTITSYSGMFNSVSSDIQVIVKDTTAQLWIQERLGSGKGNVIIAS